MSLTPTLHVRRDCKHGAFLFQQETGARVPFVVYQTANSVSAYTPTRRWTPPHIRRPADQRN